jgi:predicted O-methyltransferase YrrM
VFINEQIEKYCLSVSSTPSELLEQIYTLTHQSETLPQMLIGKMEASFLGFLIQALNVTSVLEIGTFTGYSALAMAENLPPSGTIITLDINPDPIEKIAMPIWNISPHGKKIKSIIGPAIKSIDSLDSKFDLIFIDADKLNYKNYVQKSLTLLSKNGIIVVDNTLWSGKVLNLENAEESTKAIAEMNKWVSEQKDYYTTLLPVRDGMLLIKPLDKAEH